MKKHGKNKGFSLAEGVIALTVITIISAAITTLCVSTSKSSGKLFSKFQATNIATDVVSCFKSACDESSGQTDAFEKYLKFYVGDDGIAADSSVTNCKYYEFTMDKVDAKVSAYFDDGEIYIYTYHSTMGSLQYSYGYSLTDGEIEV